MEKWTRVLCMVAVISFALTGCSSVCEDLKDGYDTVVAKGKACQSADDPDTTMDGSDVARCEAGLKNCSSDDEKAMREFADCLRDVPTCTTSNADAYGAAVLGCYFTVSSKLSDTCRTTTANSIRRKAAGYSITR